MKRRTFPHGNAPPGPAVPHPSARGSPPARVRAGRRAKVVSPAAGAAGTLSGAGVARILPAIGSGDRTLVLAFLALAVAGFSTLLSGSAGYALFIGKSSTHFALRQLVAFLFAAPMFAVAAFFPLEGLRKWAGPVMLAALAFLVLPLVPGIGDTRNGASRWIRVGGTTLQPSEFWKPVLVFYLAHLLDRIRDRPADGVVAVLPPFIVLLAGCAVIVLQSDFSTAVLVAIAGLSVFWVCGVPLSFFLGVILFFVPLATLLVVVSDYRIVRVLHFLVPGMDPHGHGYQVGNSIRAIAEGGWFGTGIGLGTRKVLSIPAVHSDFIFASFAEETGFLGVALFFALWFFVFLRGFRTAFRSGGFRSYLAFGMSFLLALQVLANTAVVSGVIPATGLPLPLFSAGGSSLVMTCICFGLLYNCTRPGGFERV